MRVLVTGATGYIGSAVLRRLASDARHKALGSIRRGMEVPVAGVSYVVVETLGPETDWQQALDGADVLLHTAARVHVMNDTDSCSLSKYREVNVDGTLNLARQAANAGLRRFVFVSSIKVNGEKTQLGKPYTEVDTPAPVDPYGMSKLETEQGLRVLADNTGMELVTVRPPLVYGPGVAANFLSMMRWIYRGIPLPLAGIHNRRTMVALDNLVDLLVTCVDHPGAAGQVILAGDGEDLSTTELLYRTGRALDKPVRLFWAPPWMLRCFARLLGKSDQIQRLTESLQVDISRTRKLLGWNPKISVNQALQQTADDFLKARK